MINVKVYPIQRGIWAMAARNLRVAIFDDDPSVRTAITRLLNASGMAGDSFATSIELFNAVEMSQPDCIVLDLYMPGLDGLEVMRYLRRTGVHSPVIIITAHDDPALRETCLQAGAAAYMRKPVEAGEFLETITRTVSGGRL